MKKVLLLVSAIMLTANIAVADHIGPYGDSSGATCNTAPGFSTTVAIIHKFSTGATGSRFKLGPTTYYQFFGFTTPFVPVGNLTTDLSLGYGSCLTGSFVLGTIIANWIPGAVSVMPADGFPNIIYTTCNFEELPASGGHMSISGDGHGCDQDPVEPTSWGKVKALYR